jgi:protein-S-isoprenylcysteine O-methyltransferase Ste14
MRATRADLVQPSRRELRPLGPRGEGWVGIQVAIELGILLLAVATLGTWAEPWHAMALFVGVLLCVAGASLFAIGATTLAGSFSIWVRPRDGARLVTGGPYRWMRHPVCTAQVVFGIGWALAWQSPPALASVAVLIWYLDRFKLEREEQWLAATYPGYDVFRGQVRHRMLPRPPASRQDPPAPPTPPAGTPRGD